MLPEFDFHAPSALEELFQLKQQFGADASVMAGGTDLLVALKSGRRRCGNVISLKGIADLDGLSYDESTGLTIGANTVLADVATYGPALTHYASLVDSIESLATPQIRQKATVAGNLCNASPCADTAMSLMALSARPGSSAPDRAVICLSKICSSALARPAFATWRSSKASSCRRRRNISARCS